MGRGRKPKVAKLDEVANADDSTNPPMENMNDGHDVGSPVTRAAKEKAGKNLKEIIRSNGRGKITVSSYPSEVGTEKIDDKEIEKEDPLVEKLSLRPSSTQQSLEEKIDFLVQSVQSFKSKGTKRSYVNEAEAVELNYKSLYLESQKMVEALTMENHQLSKKLESALAKVEVYEKMRDAFGSMKDMMLSSNLTKATDALISFTSQVTSGKNALPAIVAEPNTSFLQATSGQGTTPAVAAELLNASPQTRTGQGTTPAVAAELLNASPLTTKGQVNTVVVAAEPTASLPQATTGQVTTSTVTAEPELKRSKRGRKKKEW